MMIQQINHKQQLQTLPAQGGASSKGPNLGMARRAGVVDRGG